MEARALTRRGGDKINSIKERRRGRGEDKHERGRMKLVKER